MRLVCREYGLDIVFEENKAVDIVVESAESYLSFLSRIWNQINGGEEFIVLSEDDKVLELGKVSDFITDPFHIDINNKKIISRIYQEMSNYANSMEIERIRQIQMILDMFVSDSCDKFETPLSYEYAFNVTDIYKLYNVHIDIDETDPLSRMISYVKLRHKVLGTGLFIFSNLKSYFSEDDLRLFYETMNYEKINIMLLERYENKRSEYEKRIIIDEDSCIIMD